jgi:CubicO group peptidase (beta-lactamase class C family)
MMPRVATGSHGLVARISVPFVVAALALATCGEDGPDPGSGDPVDPSVARFLGDLLPSGAGATVVAARDGEIVHCQGFGLADREAGVRAGCDTVYDIQSITKQFTAAAILRLEMMGKLQVTDRIGKYLGPVPADKREITLHDLLTHTAGLVAALGGDYERLSRRGMVAAALHSELRSPPAPSTTTPTSATACLRRSSRRPRVWATSSSWPIISSRPPE